MVSFQKSGWRWDSYHSDTDYPIDLQTVNKICESAEDDEENVVTVKVAPDMSPEDVVQKVRQMLQVD